MVNWVFPVICISNRFELKLRGLNARPKKGAARNRLSDDSFALDISDDIWKYVS